ncbi:Na+/H+ antiporter [Streptococcus varani]|uniref:Na+/H+ antiporter n=1 Tax=Streptococcus varani TaxID=1608583 RepID=A0A0E4H6Q6_9STRE|nr:cation:proton antiporter [Streptococcus varani]CQR26072.1 Na+/H+ antiporter [Streptococcus varani]
MLASLAFVFLGGLFFASIVEKIKLPRIIGFLLVGIIIGPHLLNLLDSSLLNNSAAFRRIALIIILIKAGLTIDIKDLKQVGRPAIFMSFLPASFELFAYMIFAPFLLGLSLMDAALLGSVMAAVSPAIVVPRMVDLIDKGYGKKKTIPQLILAGASLDDIVVIVLFTSFLSMAGGAKINYFTFLNIPLSIMSGVLLGIVFGLGTYHLFKSVKILHPIQKMILLPSLSFLLVAMENWLEGEMAFSGLLAVMTMATAFKVKAQKEESKLLGKSFGNIWIAAEILLFVLVGAAVDIDYLGNAGLSAVFMILVALAIRSIGVLISVSGAHFNRKEKLFIVIAYLPKATVQAAIGSLPLAAGLPSGQLILSVAVIGIVVTAPLGAILIDSTYQHLLSQDKNE